MQNNEQNERVRPRLENASELKGKKVGLKPAAARKKRIAGLLAAVIVLGCVIGAYFITDALKPVEEETDTASTLTESVQLIEGRAKNDVDRVTVYKNGEKQYAIISNLRIKAEAQAAALETEETEAAAEQAPEIPEIPEETENGPESAADAVKDVLDNVTGVMNIADRFNDGEQPDDIPMPEELPDPEGLAELGIPAVVEEPVDPLTLPDYQVEDMPWFELKSSQASNMIVYGYTLTTTRCIEENSADLSVYGLTEPQMQLVFDYCDGTSMTINVGNKIAAGNYYYVTLDDSKDVYMCYGNIYTYNDYELNSLHVMPELAVFDTENVVTMELLVERRGAETIEMKMFDSSDETTSINLFKMVQPITYDTNSDRTAEVEANIAAITLTGYAGYAPDEASKAEFGLDDPYAHIYMLDADGNECDFTIGGFAGTSDTLRYITIDDGGNVYTVDTSLLAFLPNMRVSYLVDQFANLIYIKRINGFEITTSDTVYTATVERIEYEDNGEQKTKDVFYYEGEMADEDIFRDFYQVVIGTLFDKRIEDESEYQLEGEADVTVTYHMTYTDEPYVVEYVSYDRDYYAIRKDGYTLFLIQKDKINDMVATAESYRIGEYDGAHDTYEY